MAKFLRKTCLFFFPLAIFLTVITGLYLRLDPFGDFSAPATLNYRYKFQSPGDITTKKLLVSNRSYNGIILGSSRSVAFHACYAQELLPGTRFLHYANWSETIGGIYARLRLVDSLGICPREVILCLDPDVTFIREGLTLKTDHYLLTGESRFGYYYRHFKTFFTNPSGNKLRSLFGLQVDSVFFPNVRFDPKTNDFDHFCLPDVNYGDTSTAAANKKTIDLLRKTGYFYIRPEAPDTMQPQISAEEQEVLKKINKLAKSKNARVTVIITPLYEQKRINMRDLEILEDFFPGRVFDFSGKNSITNNIYNYKPDRYHFYPFVGRMVMDSVFLKKNLSNIQFQSTVPTNE